MRNLKLSSTLIKLLPLILSGGAIGLAFQNCSSQSFQPAQTVVAGTSFCQSHSTDSACTLNQSTTCTFNGQNVAEGASVKAYLNSSVQNGSPCQTQTRNCIKGVLSGTFAYASCSTAAAASCLFNGQTIADGGSVTAYLASTTAAGASCQSQNRNCSNGTLSGGFLYSSCEASPYASCLFNGQTISHGSSVTAFPNSTVAYGAKCSGQQRTCFNGALSGAGDYATCTVDAAASCLFSGMTVANGQQVTAYASSSGTTCTPVLRTCSNGTMSGSGNYTSCVVNQPASCYLNGVTIPSGGQQTFYFANSVPMGSTCQAELRSCNNGALTGSAIYESCQTSPVSIAALPAYVRYGKTSTLSWQSSGAVSCLVSAAGYGLWTGTNASAQTDARTGDMTYTLTCQMSDGSTASSQVTVYVEQPSTLIPEMKAHGCTWQQLVGDFSGQIDHGDAVSMLGRSNCVYLNRSLETWAHPLDANRLAQSQSDIQNIKTATGKNYIFGMFVAESVQSSGLIFDPDENRYLDFSKMCSPYLSGPASGQCYPNVDLPDYRSYVRYMTRHAMDLGVQDFIFGSVDQQDTLNFQSGSTFMQIFDEIRAYAKATGKEVTIGAQFNHGPNNSTLGINMNYWDYEFAAVWPSADGGLDNEPGNTWYEWNKPEVTSQTDVLVNLDWWGPNDMISTYAGWDKVKRGNFAMIAYNTLRGRGQGYLMSYISPVNNQTSTCMGSGAMWYTASNNSPCQDEDYLNSLLTGNTLWISADQHTFDYSQGTTIRWQSWNAQSCVVSLYGFGLWGTTNGATATGPVPNTDSTYVLTCSMNDGTQQQAQTSVHVNNAPN